MPRPARLVWLLPLAAGAVLLADRVSSHPDAPGAPLPASRRLSDVAGLLDLLSTGADLERIERLTAQDRHTEAFGEAVSELAALAERDGPFASPTLQRLQWVAASAAAGGDRETAEDLFDALLVLRRAAQPRDDLRLAETLLRRGRLARVYDDPVLARRLVAEARFLTQRRAAPPLLSAAVEQTDGAMGLRSDFGAALAGYRRALSIRRRAAGSEFLTADNLTWTAWVLDRLGRTEESERAALEARTLLRRCGLSGTTNDATLLHLLADGRADRGSWHEAAALYAEAARINRAARARHLGGFARRVCPTDGYEPLALAALMRGDGDEAWVLLESGRAALHRDLLALGREDRPDGLALRETLHALGARVRERERERRGGASAWSGTTWRDTLAILALRAQAARREQAMLETAPARPVSLRETQALLDPRTALVGWLEVDLGGTPSRASQPRRSWGYAYVVRSSGPVHWVSLWDARRPPEEDTDREGWGPSFARVRRAASWPLRVDPDPEVDRGLREWTRRFFDPLQPWLAGVDRLIVEGTRLPAELFRDASGRSFLDRYTISYAPSAAFLTDLRGREHSFENPRFDRSGRPLRVLALSAGVAPRGGPALDLVARDDEPRALRFTRDAFRRDQVSLDRLPRLRFAGLEARDVAERFPAATLLQGEEAEPRLRALAEQHDLAGYDVIHVATHTLFDAAPERSGLVLAEQPPAAAAADDGVLEAEEIALGWRLHGSLVTLSACESGRTAGIMRGEDLGLAPALFAAGADRVVVSLWPVDDRATALLMDRFYDGLAAGLFPEAALREAKRAVRDVRVGDRSPFIHPAYWGGFVLIGLPSR